MVYLPFLFTRLHGLRTAPPGGRARSARSWLRDGRAATPGARGARASLDGLLASKEIVVACGPGGVGKTTTAAAAAAMAAARLGGKVLVLTVDPARRLADALGLEGIGNAERRVPDETFVAAGVKPMGRAVGGHARHQGVVGLPVRLHAPDARTRDAILSNPLYRNISARFVQSHDYIAMERLFEIHSDGNYDLIVVDTPPTRNALDFLDAPERMAEFFSSRLLRWLIVPYRSRLVNFASKPFYQIADRILGTQFLEDVAEFFILFQSMYDGFVERARAVHRLMADRRTSFIVVSTLEAGAPARGGVLRPGAEGPPAASRRHRPQQGAARLPARSPRARSWPRSCVTGPRSLPRRSAPRCARATSARSGGCWPRSAGATSTTGSWPSARPSSGPSWPRCPRPS